MRKSFSLPSLAGLHASASTASLAGLADAAADDELFEDDDEGGGGAAGGLPEEGPPADDAGGAGPAGEPDAARERKKGALPRVQRTQAPRP
jgi:hypothetical protein